MPSIDYDRLKQMISILDVLGLLGIGPTLFERTKLRRSCPLGCHVDPYACKIDTAQNVWHCHRCKKGGGALDLYMAVKGLSVYQAAREVCRRLVRPVPFQPRARERRPRAPRNRNKAVASDGPDVLE